MRKGNITASRALDFMSRGRGKAVEFGETAKSYAMELALERMGIDTMEITGMDISTWQMEWGIEHESDAREIYSNSRKVTVDLPGFIQSDNKSGCTPDGLIRNDGMLEIKCPQWKNHLTYLMNGPEKRYIYQMQFQMMVTGRDWCDFVTYHPEFDGKLRIKTHRIERDDTIINEMIERLPKFNVLVDELIEKLS